MFDLPTLDITNVERIADWVELCAFCGENEVVSAEQAGDVLKDAGQLGFEDGDVPPDDEYFADGPQFSSDDQISDCTEAVWRVLMHRQRYGGYPFVVREKTIRRMCGSWTDAPAFTMLLLADLGRWYEGLKSAELSSDGKSGKLFEHITAAACQRFFGGSCVRFGWPRNSGWPTSIDDRIEKLADEVGLQIEKLNGKTEPKDKDRTLDVLALMQIGAAHAALPRVLIQCAVGEHWRKKTGEPTTAKWKDILQWEGPLLRAVAIPWRLEDWSYKRAMRHFDDAIILDRPRLVIGLPDKELANQIGQQVTQWCEAVIAQLPRLACT